MNKEIFVKRNKEDEEIQDVVKVVVESTLSEVVTTAVCDDEENGIICLYEAERPKDEVLEDINLDVGIDKHMDSECGSDTEDPSRYEPKGGTNCVDDQILYCRACVSCKKKKVRCLGRCPGNYLLRSIETSSAQRVERAALKDRRGRGTRACDVIDHRVD